jgi:hypothetical protein
MKIEISGKYIGIKSKSGKEYGIIRNNKVICVQEIVAYPYIYFSEGRITLSLDEYITIDLVKDNTTIFLTISEYNYQKGVYFYYIFLPNKEGTWEEVNNGVKHA